MNRFFFGALLFTCLLSGRANAQAFAPGSNVVDNSAKVSQETVNKAASLSKSTADKAKAAATEEEGAFVKSVEKNFGTNNAKEEKKYDNTMGKVFQFKIADGKVIFDEDRKILVSYENFKVERGMDGIVRCSMRIYVLNDLLDRISSLGMKLKWPQISTNVQMNKVNPGIKTYMDVTLLGEGCLGMDKTPTIEVNRCRVKGMSENKCADAILWFKKTQ